LRFIYFCELTKVNELKYPLSNWLHLFDYLISVLDNPL